MDLPLAQKTDIIAQIKNLGYTSADVESGKAPAPYAITSETTSYNPSSDNNISQGVVNMQDLSGKSLENYRRMSSFAEARGGRIVVRDDLEPGNPGFIIKNDDGTFEIVVADEALADYVVMGHELTHALEGTDKYIEYGFFIINELRRQGADIAEIKRAIIRAYAEQGKQLDGPGAVRELVAMYTAKHLFDDQVVINRLAVERPSLFRRIWEWLQDAIAMVFGKKSAFYVNVRKRFIAAYRSAGGAHEGRWGEDTGRQDMISRVVDDKTGIKYNEVEYREDWSKVLTKQDFAEFYSTIGKPDILEYLGFQKARNGNVIIEIRDEKNNKIKLIYHDGNYVNPGITRVIVFNSSFDTEVDIARRLIYEYEKGESEIGEAMRAIESSFGPSFIGVYTGRTDGLFEGQAGRRKGTNRSENNAYAENNGRGKNSGRVKSQRGLRQDSVEFDIDEIIRRSQKGGEVDKPQSGDGLFDRVAEKASEEEYMADVGNIFDWSEAKSREVSKEEKEDIIEYARSHGINIVDLSRFDGDPEIVKAQIKTLDLMRRIYPEVFKKKLTITFSDCLSDDTFAEINNRTIVFNNKPFRNRAVTEKILRNLDFFASNRIEDIVIHEFGHLVARIKGNRGIEIAMRAYYNVHNKEISYKGIVKYLKDNISEYCITYRGDFDQDELLGKVKYTKYNEVISEVFAKHYSKPNDFTREFVKLLKGV